MMRPAKAQERPPCRTGSSPLSHPHLSVVRGLSRRQPSRPDAGGATLGTGQKSSADSSGIQPAARSTARAHALRSSGGAGLDHLGRAPRCRRRRRSLPTRRRPARRGTRRRASSPRRPATPRPARPVASASAWTNVGLALIPPSTRSVVDRQAGVGLGGLDEVGAAVGDALEHRPHDVGRRRAARDPEQRAARPVVPRRRAQAEQRRHVDARRRSSRTVEATSWVCAARLDEAEVVAQPLDVGARRQHDRLDPPRQRAGLRPGHDRDTCRGHLVGPTTAPRGRGRRRASRRCRT